MQNLKSKIMEEEKKYLIQRIEKFAEELKEVEENELTWTERCLGRKEVYKTDREKKVIDRLTNSSQKEIERLCDKIDEVMRAENTLDRALIINIVFKKNNTWGYCPIAEDNYGNYTRSITGCGCDKESTASAIILNMNNNILKRMYKLKNDNIDLDNGELFGYGSGYGILPYFEGGVGIDCHVRILEKLGFKVQKSGTSSTTVLVVSE